MPEIGAALACLPTAVKVGWEGRRHGDWNEASYQD